MYTIHKEGIKKVINGSIVSPDGFFATGVHTKVKRKRNDLGVIVCDRPAQAAAVFTLNQIQAAPITVTKESLAKSGNMQAVIVNSGNANACSGKQGLQDAYAMQRETAEKFAIDPHLVAVASTGVIGEAMPMDKIINGIRLLKPSNEELDVKAFNEAILTTDTVEKSTCYQATIAGETITMAGSAKGSGMIAPNMATMLAFITTDANIQHTHLQTALKTVTDETFNLVTVDGDTSTNDMVLVLANGAKQHEELTPNHKDWPTFIQLLKQVCEDLAKMIAKDGEGATKLIEVEVQGAATKDEANQIAKTVVGSNLVKTMVFGNDPNWGRVMMAIGKSGMTINPEQVDISIGSFPILQNSQPVSFSKQELENYLKGEKIHIGINVHIGNAKGKAWGCDLTYDYVKINANYRT